MAPVGLSTVGQPHGPVAELGLETTDQAVRYHSASGALIGGCWLMRWMWDERFFPTSAGWRALQVSLATAASSPAAGGIPSSMSSMRPHRSTDCSVRHPSRAIRRRRRCCWWPKGCPRSAVAQRWHAPLAYWRRQSGTAEVVERCRSRPFPSHILKADASVSRLPTVAASEPCAAVDPA